MSFWLHLFGTDLPIMIVIYSILMPRYFKLFSSMTAYLLDTVSYPTMHIFESGTRYDSIGATAMSLTFVYLLLMHLNLPTTPLFQHFVGPSVPWLAVG
jgi:hypothetical protein